ncbi:MAG: DUF6978 family protein [Planctomycetaceae bacterium]
MFLTEINLRQGEADALIAMPKVRADDEERDFPLLQQSVIVPLLSEDRRETFMLDIHSGRINLSKITFQNRGRQVVVLVRLDIAGPPHRNPDGEEISCPHLHVYREGFGDKWAETAPIDKFTALNDPWQTLQDFMQFCSIVTPPAFRKGLLHD